ncbi:MAG: protein kinase, partial [Planctomycetota bacterium]
DMAGTPRIVDFGLSKSMFSRRKDDGDQTVDGTIMGTPLFMSPEQARGETSRVDGRTDIYAAATMLYIMLLKTHPHPIESRESREIIRTIATSEARSPNLIKPNFNSRLSQILMKALAKNPQDRFTSAGDFAEALQRFLERK